uniref:Uncharacterized protein n=1 Tax=Klebsiella pneumoniae TaxID=573 RepID=A0A5P1PKL5_KLEPN|nr:hypothetical protein [Klebsiella pneumoniae]
MQVPVVSDVLRVLEIKFSKIRRDISTTSYGGENCCVIMPPVNGQLQVPTFYLSYWLESV